MGFVLCYLGRVRKKSEKFLFFFFLQENTEIFIEVSPCSPAEKTLKNLQPPLQKTEEFAPPQLHFPGGFSNAEQETTETVIIGAK